MDPNGENHHESTTEFLLRNIDEILMGEEEMDPQMVQELSSEFRAKERSFYEAIGQEYPNDAVSPPIQEFNGDDVWVCRVDEALGQEYPNDAVSPPIQEFNEDDVWVCRVDGRDEELEACIADLTISMNNIIMQQPDEKKKKKNKRKKDVEVAHDLRALLFSCAKSVVEGNHRTANNLLELIKQHSSPSGNEIQRLAYYFVDGLESRLAVANSYCQAPRISNPPDYLKTLFVARASASFLKMTSFITNKMIMIESEKKTTTRVIHVIDFGILYGFQRPSLIKCVADNQREGGPLKLRITGIDFPHEAGIIEDTGRRLACYAETLAVPFEYKAIAQEWEKIKIGDLKIEKGEFVAVFCSTRSLKLMDDVVVGVARSPRDEFLKLVRRISPDIFMHEIVNAGYNNPSFWGRFRELWFHYLALFDMMETFLPRDNFVRSVIERDLFAKEVWNVIACEGPERVERPETYRQWQVRHVKAGFMQVPFQKELIDTVMEKMKGFHHKDFAMAENSKWLLTSWKGRVIFALSCYQPADLPRSSLS